MLWINLIMDILGAIAIGTEPYRKTDTVSSRISRSDKIVRVEMLRQVIVQSIYQIIVMMILMYFGGMMFFDESLNLVTTPLRDGNGNPTNRLVLNTICFHTFFLMNWFNTLNCRIVDVNEINVFKTILNNPYLWLIMGLEMFFQLLMIRAGSTTLGSALLGTAPMTAFMNLICWIFGIFSLVVNIGLKKIPVDKFKFAEKIDLESSNPNSFIDRYMNKADDMYNKAN